MRKIHSRDEIQIPKRVEVEHVEESNGFEGKWSPPTDLGSIESETQSYFPASKEPFNELPSCLTDDKNQQLLEHQRQPHTTGFDQQKKLQRKLTIRKIYSCEICGKVSKKQDGLNMGNSGITP